MDDDLKVKEIFCTMCKKITKHIDVSWMGILFFDWKCTRCGEYNHEQPKKEN